jgi:hypothetical protein
MKMKKFCKHGHEMTKENTKIRRCKGYNISECLTCVRNATRKKRDQTEKIVKGDEEVVLSKDDAPKSKKLCDDISEAIWESLIAQHGDYKETGKSYHGIFVDIFVKFYIGDDHLMIGRIRKCKTGENKYTIWR